ncbi:MAG TPA: DUF1501 domain-containing protein [Pirellulales bacterium]|jgi:hypothetical protein|nr:DUF1501 domain-containing protein [Pirellulales bacterium]
MLLRAVTFGGVSWLTTAANLLARDDRQPPQGRPAQSLIMIWLAGGPSQLETFDPHSGTKIAAGTTAIDTSRPGVQFAAGYDRLAEQMQHMALVRNVVSKEGDHERGTSAVKTGYRPDPTFVHPSIGAICCHQLSDRRIDIPRHISILPGRFPSRGGILGSQYDAFKTGDPASKVADTVARVSADRQRQRLEDRLIVEQAFARGRARQVDATLHNEMVAQASRMMSSEQLKAFDVSLEPAEVRAAYGETPFGRGCLAARRLIGVGVRCVEVTLDGWDSHVNNHEIHARRAEVLDPALAALIGDLHLQGLLDNTLVLCTGEFGRSPEVNGAGGRDHWPHGFSMLLAGGRLPRGAVIGETDPEGGRVKAEQAIAVADIHATLLTALGIDPKRQVIAPLGRPVKLSEGTVVPGLLS